ncbi:MAG: hypothetical protein QOJ64_1397 [Acidobacteriota bacterium]|jgi:hypothetical protein|nr:hypothetical protein [Acidobacteriota bacterium]
MPRKRVVKKHSVKAHLQISELSKAGSSLELEIYASKQKIGTLIIGRGSLFWYGRNRQIRKRVSWTRFAEMMDELAYGSSR